MKFENIRKVFNIGEGNKISKAPASYTEADLALAKNEFETAEKMFIKASDILSPEIDEVEAQKIKDEMIEKRERYFEVEETLRKSKAA